MQTTGVAAQGFKPNSATQKGANGILRFQGV